MKKFFLMRRPGVRPVYLDNDRSVSSFLLGEPIVEIMDDQDEAIIDPLIDEVNKGNKEAVDDLFKVLDRYNHEAALQFLIMIGEEDLASKIQGDDCEKKGLDSDAFKHYLESASRRFKCSMCKVGRYYAEGKGCKKNKEYAKEWLEDAAKQCVKAETYLDKYGLR